MDKKHIILPTILTFLGCSSCLLLYTHAVTSGHNTYFYLRQTIWVVISLAAFFAIRKIPHSRLEKYAPWIASVGIAILIAVLIGGTKINGMSGWFTFGKLSLQPSEICKPAFIIWNAWLLNMTHQAKQKTKFVFATLLSLILWMALIILEPDLGTGIVYFITFIGMHYVIGSSPKFILSILAIGIICAAIIIAIHPYAAKRIRGFFADKESTQQTINWQTQQMQKCLHNGGWFGMPQDNNSQNTPLPYETNDSLFAFAAEHMGFFGVVPLVLLPLLWLIFC